MYSLNRVRAKFSESQRGRLPQRKGFSVHVHYDHETTLRIFPPSRPTAEAERVVRPLLDRDIEDVQDLLRRVRKLERLGEPVTIYPDAEELIQQRLFQNRVAKLVSEIRANPADHPLRTELLDAELLPYQLDGIAFAVGAGRAILADDMGLGKTIQGLGVARLLAQVAGIRRVLVICPTSFKSQWRNKIHRFSDSDVQLVVGSADERTEQYDNECFFTICNYEQVLRDVLSIERVKWDLIILDEGQRIKNWASKTSNVVKSLRSPLPSCCRARRWKTGSMISIRLSSSSTTGDWPRRFSSLTGIGSSIRTAR